VNASSWLQLSDVGVPPWIPVGGSTSTITVAMVDTGGNGDGAVSASFPSTPVGLSTTLGSIPAAAVLTSGLAAAGLKSGDTPGPATVTALLDNATATTQVLFGVPVTPKFTG
jgi:hypothetical protein